MEIRVVERGKTVALDLFPLGCKRKRGVLLLVEVSPVEEYIRRKGRLSRYFPPQRKSCSSWGGGESEEPYRGSTSFLRPEKKSPVHLPEGKSGSPGAKTENEEELYGSCHR